jgi:hypothetical protein
MYDLPIVFPITSRLTGPIDVISRSTALMSFLVSSSCARATIDTSIDPIWEDQIPLQTMGTAYEKCANFVDAARYYESYIQEPWARDGWLRVKIAHREFYSQSREYEKAERIDSEIRNRRSAWGF